MPIDRFDEIVLKARRGDVISITGYYGEGVAKSVKYPLRMEFEVLRWPVGITLRDLSYSFTRYWLDGVILPLQPPDIKWHRLTIRFSRPDQQFQVPLVGKYGLCDVGPASDKAFGVNLIQSNNAKRPKTFHLRGVALAYEQFDRPEADRAILDKVLLLEQALVSPFSIQTEAARAHGHPQEGAILRYVKVAPPVQKGSEETVSKKPLLIRFTAVFTAGFV